MSKNILKVCNGFKNVRSYSSLKEMPICEFKPVKYEGPSYEQLQNIRQTKLNPALTTFYSKPLALNQGYKQWLFDINGKRYLDLFGGICTVSVGHCHPKVNEATIKQLETLTHVSNIYYHPKLHEYASRLADKMPGNLKVVYFVNSGSEANDLAMLMARVYTNNFEILSLMNAYHGMSPQSMGLTSMPSYRYSIPQPPGIHHVMNPDVYTGLWGGSHCRDSPVQTKRTCDCSPNECKAGDNYLQQLSQFFTYNLASGHVAAMFAESIQGLGGVVQFPKNYIKGAYKLVKEYGGLFVSDEVQAGFGRTGDHFWGFEAHGITPDIVTMAKGIGNGYPLAAVVTTPDIAKALTKSGHFNTFGGNPVASAVGIAVLDVIEEEKLQENSKKVGTYFLLELEKLSEKYPVIGDVRGKGLMIGVELVNPGTKEPLDRKKSLQVLDESLNMGVILGKGGIYGNVLRIKPPMCVTKEDVDFSLSVLEEVFKKISQ
ncbi:alanine--glyoxylate aminotransferase 2, mitochondrial [Onthophagus taurus]|uniref:alanine--glyoxylate aminotransferase 2, mitochondrial n=1 Tax=Onthophagus taurus TaxID=166361 RepID=UPI0039BDA69C